MQSGQPRACSASGSSGQRPSNETCRHVLSAASRTPITLPIATLEFLYTFANIAGVIDPDGGWAGEVTQSDCAISDNYLRGQHATDLGRHPRDALASV